MVAKKSRRGANSVWILFRIEFPVAFIVSLALSGLHALQLPRLHLQERGREGITQERGTETREQVWGQYQE